MITTKLRITWLIGAIVLSFAKFAGGDTSIVAGLAWLVWTAPFGFIWQFYVYGNIPELVSVETTQIIGVILTVVTAFVFWFQFFPAVSRWSRGRKNVF